MPIIETSLTYLMSAAIVGGGSLLLATTGWMESDQRLIAVCISGGIAGGLLAVLVFPLVTLRQTAAKWLASGLAGGLFGPAVCKFYGFEESLTYSLPASGVIGLFAWTALMVLIPLCGAVLPKVVKAYLKKWFPVAFNPDKLGIEREPLDWVEKEKDSKKP